MSVPSLSTPPSSGSYARDVRATWWYTAASIVFFQLTVLFLGAVLENVRPGPLPVGWAAALFLAGSVASVAGAVALLIRYRRDGEDDDAPRRTPWPLAAALAGAALVGVATASPLLGAGLAGFALCLVRWRGGVRRNLAIVLLFALAALAVIEGGSDPANRVEGIVVPVAFFAVVIGPLSAVSLWWWDIVRELDRARAAEGRLAAAQERLRLASDLHDLQGHHLQVIALQLELAERMMPRDPAAALAHVRAARGSVDDARRGTRELAARFRGVPLPDELANAADLLRAAGLRVQLDVAADAAAAPSDVLGPIVREATTNILKHGGGEWARVRLARDGAGWVLEVANDPSAPGPGADGGAGLRSIADRAAEAGGAMTSAVTPDAFTVIVTIPIRGSADADGGDAR